MWHHVLICTGTIAAMLGIAVSESAGVEGPSAMTARLATQGKVQNSDTERGIARSDDGLFYAMASSSHGVARVLIDTGATHVVLTRSDAERLNGKPIGDSATNIATAGGRVEVDWVLLDKIEIHGHVLRSIKAAVPRRDIGVSLLGQNALAQFRSVRIDGDHLTLTR